MLISMLIFFLTPIVAVVAMYKMDWRPKGESIGELISPPRLLAMHHALVDSDGSVAPSDVWNDKWSMVYIAESCEAACKETLHTMRQLHVSLYKEIPRMQRMLITTSTNVSNLKQRYPELIVLNQPLPDIIALTEQFNIKNEQSTNADRIYLVDPRGHLILSYPPATEPSLIRKEITRLMKYSWAG